MSQDVIRDIGASSILHLSDITIPSGGGVHAGQIVTGDVINVAAAITEVAEVSKTGNTFTQIGSMTVTFTAGNGNGVLLIFGGELKHDNLTQYIQIGFIKDGAGSPIGNDAGGVNRARSSGFYFTRAISHLDSGDGSSHTYMAAYASTGVTQTVYVRNRVFLVLEVKI